VRHDGNIRIFQPLPGRKCRVELEPGRPKVKVIGLGRAPDPVHAVGYALEQAGLQEARYGTPGDTSGAGLLQRDQAPLALSSFPEPGERTRHTAKYSLNVIL